MTAPEILLETETDTAAFGAKLAPVLRAGDVICLSGELGAGKTTLARGLIQALYGDAEATSPTFTFVETYETSEFTLWHFDLYRLDKAGDVWELGLEEALDQGVVIIEWPERIETLAPENALTIRLEIKGPQRVAHFNGDEEWRRRLGDAGIASW